jgi:RimJ/RimL family protein N-acetyltransferase
MALPIFTERLVLRPYEPDDLEQLHAVLYSDADAMRLLGGPRDVAGTRFALGYAFGARWWGRGYATEAARAVIAEAFGDLDMDRLVAITREANVGSRHVLEKLGFQMEGVRHVWGAEQLFFVLDRDFTLYPAAG